jgi:branched-chain amino acid aminotransferase
MTTFCFYNGHILPKHQIHISVDDLGFSRGYALFEHCRTYFQLPFHLHDHLVRLKRGADALFLPFTYSLEDYSEALNTLIQRNNFEESGFKIYLTAGTSIDGLTPSAGPNCIIYPYPLPRYEGHYPGRGLILKTTSLTRAFPEYKTTFYLPGLLARRINSPCDDILFMDHQRHLLEGTTAGFLAFIGNTLIVPEGPRLVSVTQEVLIKLASSLFKVEYRPIAYLDIPRFTEAFLCSSTKEVLPVEQIDDHRIGTVSEYKNILLLNNLLTAYIRKKQWPILSTTESALFQSIKTSFFLTTC